MWDCINIDTGLIVLFVSLCLGAGPTLNISNRYMLQVGFQSVANSPLSLKFNIKVRVLEPTTPTSTYHLNVQYNANRDVIMHKSSPHVADFHGTPTQNATT
jgi:hypothetical protein